MLKGIEAVHIANEGLNWRNQQGHPHRHGEHFTYGRGIVPAQKVPGGRGAHEHRTAEKSGDRHV